MLNEVMFCLHLLRAFIFYKFCFCSRRPSTLTLNCNYVATKTLEERIGLPEKPKKPLTPYFRFLKEERPSIAAANPDASLTDVVKLVAKKWATESETKKKQLEEMYKKDQVVYMQKRANYDNKLTVEEKMKLREMKLERTENKQKKLQKKQIKELGKPKRPPSAFIQFMNIEKVKRIDKSVPYKEWQKEMATRWNNLSDADKESALKSSKVDMQKYRVELAKWEEKMVRMGNIEMVRHQLIDAQTAKPKRRSSAISVE